MAPKDSKNLKRDNRNVTIFVLSLLFAMCALTVASVPLYKIFCQKTGYGGTPKTSYTSLNDKHERTIKVRFNANIHRDLPWSFKPLQTEMTVHIGETSLALYQVTNKISKPLIGIAAYNVTPDKAAQYFVKVECFCYENQTIPPKHPIDLPVQFYIDPGILKDPSLKDVDTITLSYTFFHAKDFNWANALRGD